MSNIGIGFRVPGLTAQEIERKAEKFRSTIGFRNPSTKIITIIEKALPEDAFDWSVVEDGALENDLARTTPDKLKIEITNSIYESACDGDPVSNHILAHELGHLILHENVDPSFAYADSKPPYNSIFNSEWQADRFADFLRMPGWDVLATCQSVEDIKKRYSVPEEAAQRRFVELFGPEQMKFDF